LRLHEIPKVAASSPKRSSSVIQKNKAHESGCFSAEMPRMQQDNGTTQAGSDGKSGEMNEAKSAKQRWTYDEVCQLKYD
jgi:hypothetical protein